MKLLRLFFICVFFTPTVFSQLTEKNQAGELKEQAAHALAAVNMPLSPEQEKELALLIEEERQAAENLFGTTWDFTNGPPQGDQRDQALAGIRWMYTDLKGKIPAYLTDAQKGAWEKYQVSALVAEQPIISEIKREKAASEERIQQIRVTNNAFNVETGVANGALGPQSGGAKTEVIERGGVGALHGLFASTFQDDKFNARNPYANNKPPYYERLINGNLSGPVIQNRLSLNFTFLDDKKENVGTVQAQLPTGRFALGVTRPTLNRSYDLRSTYQLANAHSLVMDLQYASGDSQNENVGDFGLPERASRTQTRNYVGDLREISILSPRFVHDVHFILRRDRSETVPFSNAPAIIVKDAFTAGGAQNQALSIGTEYQISNLIYYAGDKLTMRSGFQGWQRRQHTDSHDNFYGEWTYSDLASYLAGKPLKYRITCCEPYTNLTLTQLGWFTQNDIKLTKEFTLMLGLRYQRESVIRNPGQWNPRIGFAYAVGKSTVIRGGAGVFNQLLGFSTFDLVNRLDGIRKYETQINNPGYPNPFASGIIQPRSRRQIARDMGNAYLNVGQIGIERSLPHNLFVTFAYDFVRNVGGIRARDVNAPLPGTGIRPNPDEGQVYQFQSSGVSTNQHIKASLRQRFSVFVVTTSYTYLYGRSDQEDRRNVTLYLPVDSYDLHRENGNTTDPRHNFTTSINSKLPLGGYLTTVLNAHSGTFYTITTGKDDNHDGVINDRPPGAMKNAEVGPNYFDVGFNFSKAYELRKRTAPGTTPAQMNMFANLNNAFNTQHPGIPSGVMTSPFFLKSYNATNPRTMQVGVRFQF